MSAVSPRQILGTLAALAPDRQPETSRNVVRRDIVPISLSFTGLFANRSFGMISTPFDIVQAERTGLDPDTAGPLIKRAKLHDDEGLLRVGWFWLNTQTEDGEQLFPLVWVPVRSPRLQSPVELARRVLSTPSPLPVIRSGDVELSDAIADPFERSALEATVAIGGGAFATERDTSVAPALLTRMPQLQRWAMRAAAGAGFPAVTVGGSLGTPYTPSSRAPAQVIPQVALYLAEAEQRLSATIGATLRSWDPERLDQTALSALYRSAESTADAAGAEKEDAVVRSSIVLSPSQREAVASARIAPVTVISGPPGSGKTQTIAAIALDAVERDQSVLIAAPSAAAVDALIDLMTRIPGPDPMVFGASSRRDEVADRLAVGGGAVVAAAELRRFEERRRQAVADAAGLRLSMVELLSAEALASSADPAIVFHHRMAAPKWFEPVSDLAEAQRMAEQARTSPRWFAARVLRKRVRALQRHAGAGEAVDLQRLETALQAARAARTSVELQAGGGLDLDRMWQRLIECEDEARASHAAWLDAWMRSEQRIDSEARTTMGLVAAALRSGRSVRRQKLGEIDGTQLVRALPLWVGTLRDVDDLLPRSAGMFDLVIVDEASQVDQITAAPGTLRARRCVVVGDPKQLRHVSFLADEAIERALLTNDVFDPVVIGKLDVRRVGLFDLAAASAPTHLLDEHHRSAPHLIAFSARRFYDGKVTVATTHPRNHDRDCISVVQVGGSRSEQGVNRLEIDAIVAIVRERLQRTRSDVRRTSVGVVTPFRAQADALDEALIAQFSLEEIDEIELRSGTVHGFQGCERDLVIVSLGLDGTSSPGSRAFVSDANLFNVMITRAREELIVVTSVAGSTTGLIGEYLRHGEAPPSAPVSRRVAPRRVVELAADLRAQGVAVTLEYPCGRHDVDLVVGGSERAIGVLFGVHPDGPDAHIERHLALDRAGWNLREVFWSKWEDRLPQLAVDLLLDARAGDGTNS